MTPFRPVNIWQKSHYFNLKNPFPMSSLRSQILSDVMEEKDILLKYQEAVDTAMGEHPHPHPSHPQQQLLGLGLPPLVMQRQPPAPCSSSSPASSSPSPSDAFTKAASLLLQQSSSHLRHPPHPLRKHSVFTGVIRRKNRWEADFQSRPGQPHDLYHKPQLRSRLQQI